MPVTDIVFQGINRAISDYSSTGACEELINLRPTTGGLVPVKPFSVKMRDVSFDKVLTHQVGSDTNYIAIRTEVDGIYISRISDTGEILENLANFQVTSADDIHFAAVGNIALFSIADNTLKRYYNRAFIWKDGAYHEMEADIPQITAEIRGTYTEVFVRTGVDYTSSTPQEQVIDQLGNAFNALQELHKDFCFGPIIVALAFKTNDNKTFWTGQWLVYDPSRSFEGMPTEYPGVQYYYGSSQIPSSAQKTYPNGAYVVKAESPGTGKVYLAGTKAELRLPRITGWNKDTSIIKSVEVYASRPRLLADPVLRYGESFFDNALVMTLLPKIGLDEMELDNQLLYLQKSVPLETLASLGEGETHPVPLEFGGNYQVTNTTLDVDAGAVTRYGKMLAFNARFHFYDSVAKTEIGMPYFDYDRNQQTAERHVFVIFNDGEKDETLYVGTTNLPADGPSTIIAPSLNIKEVQLAYLQSGQTWVFLHYPMTESQKYNYAINLGNSTQEIRVSPTFPAITSYVLTDEPSAINVTEQYNPFVFSVDNSYYTPGAVLDIQPQMVTVKDVSFGDYPLNVFTNRGVYALLQGSGKRLYDYFKSISNLVTTSNSVPTESGTFFIAAGGLWLISGATAVLVSDALSLGPHKYIRNCPGYQAISNSEYNIKPFESKVIFEEYVDGASLCYNRFRDELIVSNPLYAYSYVLSLKYRQWFKINLALSQDVVGSSIAAVGFVKGTKAVAGLTAEVPVDIRFLHDYIDGEIEIEVNLQGTPMSYVLTVNFQEVGQDYSSFVNYLIAKWNLAHGDVLHAGAYTGPSGDFVYIPMTFAQSIPGVTAVEGSIDMSTEREEGHSESNSFSFPDPMVTIADFSDETEDTSALVHLQSRPFSFAYQYSHVHRIVSMIRAALSGDDELIVTLYGSDDLQNWALLSYGERDNVVISQIRTSPAARSWRYYTVCIGGITPMDTDFGPVMIDYQPVVRRLG